jgi:tetratricopeptide (TPR) repeat protein
MARPPVLQLSFEAHMTQTEMDLGRRFPRLRFGSVAVALLLLMVAACGGKSPSQLAQDSLNAGIAAHSAGNMEEAQRQYQECLKHEVTNKICHYNLGLVAQTKNDLVAAENEYRLSLSTDPNYTPSLFNLAIVRTAAGDVTEAIALYTKYTQLKPEDAGGHLNLGLLLVQDGQLDAGQKEIQAAIALDPTISVPQASPSTRPTASESPTASPSAETSPSG